MDYSKKRTVNKPIPDNDPNGLIDRIYVNRNLEIIGVDVHVHIKHPYTGDISIELTAPNGFKKTILSPSRVNGVDMSRHFNGDLMSGFVGLKSKGEWTLKTMDAGANDSGDLVDWTLSLRCTPDNTTEIFIDDKNELSSVQTCQLTGKVSKLSLLLNIDHSHIGDLICSLKAPSGKSVIIHNKTGGSQNNLSKTYDSSNLKELIGENSEGDWTLNIIDQLKGDAGKLTSWKLDIETNSTSS